MLGIIKSDVRYEYLYDLLIEDNINTVYSNKLVDFYDIDILILPFGGIDEKYNIKNSNINLLDILRVNKIIAIYVGISNGKLKELCDDKNILLFEMLKDEEFVIENAHITGLGVIDYLSNKDKIINDYHVMIFGFGYVGFSLAKLLKSNKVDFSIYTLNDLEYKYVSLMEYNHANLLDSCIIINTIPHNIDIDYKLLENKWILDISSPPYGFDINKINEHGIKYEVYSNIPSKFCPYLASKIIKKYIEKTTILIYN